MRFTNGLPEPTTTCWHGVRVPNGMDGVPHPTQPPVEPGGTFLYEITPKDAGTPWFHPHVRSSEQVERGLYGVLIIEDERPAFYDADVVWVLDDWLLDEQRQIFGQFNTMQFDLMHDGAAGGTSSPSTGGRGAVAGAPGRPHPPAARHQRQWPHLQAGLRRPRRAHHRRRRPVPAGGHPLSRLRAGPRQPAGPSTSGSGRRSAVCSRWSIGSTNSSPITSPISSSTGSPDPTGRRTGLFAPRPTGTSPPGEKRAGPAGETKQFLLNARRGGEHGIEWTINDAAFAGHDHAAPPALTMRAGTFQHLQFTNLSTGCIPFTCTACFSGCWPATACPWTSRSFAIRCWSMGEESVDVGLVPLDAGRWMMHCHILEHAEAGMMTTLEVLPPT